jgi:hypothetical protein
MFCGHVFNEKETETDELYWASICCCTFVVEGGQAGRAPAYEIMALGT